MSKINGCRKGKAQEREACRLLTRLGWPTERNARNGKSEPDLVTPFVNLHLEIKSAKAVGLGMVALTAACDQATMTSRRFWSGWSEDCDSEGGGDCEEGVTWRSENMLDMDGWPHRETNEAVIVWMRGTGSVTQSENWRRHCRRYWPRTTGCPSASASPRSRGRRRER
jgi:hypothetical protein